MPVSFRWQDRHEILILFSGSRGRRLRGILRCLPRHVPQFSGPFRADPGRPPADKANCLLSFLYAMLRIAVHGALEQVGLDPYIGYLHGVRPRQASAGARPHGRVPASARRPAHYHSLQPRRTSRSRLSAAARPSRPAHRRGETHVNAWQRSRDRTWPHRHLNRDVPAALFLFIQARLLSDICVGIWTNISLDPELTWTCW